MSGPQVETTTTVLNLTSTTTIGLGESNTIPSVLMLIGRIKPSHTSLSLRQYNGVSRTVVGSEEILTLS